MDLDDANSANPNGDSQLAERRTWSPRYHLIWALVLFLVDALYVDQGILTLLVAFIFFLRIFIGAALDLFQKRALDAGNLKRFGVYLVCLLAVGNVHRINNQIAKSRAGSVIAAVRQYKAKYHEYPKKLDALVPEFLPAVPAAKFNVAMSNRFWYSRTDGGATLFYVEMPPYGRPTFNFEKDKWGYID